MFKSVSKDELRKQLEKAVEEKLSEKPDAVVLYAAEIPAERRAWRPKPSLTEKVYREELNKIEAKPSAAP